MHYSLMHYSLMHYELSARPGREHVMVFTIPNSDVTDNGAIMIAHPDAAYELADIRVNKSDGRNCGRGTVLLHAAVAWAIEEGYSTQLTGIFSPDERERRAVERWYDKRAIRAWDYSLSGYLHEIIESCELIMAQRKLQYAIQWST